MNILTVRGAPDHPAATALAASTSAPRASLRLLPGTLLPAAWLSGDPLRPHLPGLRQALAEGRLQYQALPFSAPAGCDWAHARWLRGHPALAAPLPEGGFSALQSAASTSALSFQTDEAPLWLMQPVTFRLTTDRIMLDPVPGAAVTQALAQRLTQSIAPLLADSGLTIHVLAPDRWLLRPAAENRPSWQLTCTPLEAVGEQHIDELLPQGPDARLFRQLLNEIQMTWHQLTLNDAQDLPVNAVWLSGPVYPAAIQALRTLQQQGLILDERCLIPRLTQDLTDWLAQLSVLDTWFQADPDGFSCLLAGEHALHWLYAPGAAEATRPLLGLPTSALSSPTSRRSRPEWLDWLGRHLARRRPASRGKAVQPEADPLTALFCDKDS